MAIDLSTVGTTTAGTVFTGLFFSSGDSTGWSVASAGDMNGDGFEDMLIGSPNGGFYYQGTASIVFGSAAPTAAVDLTALGAAGFQLTGVYGGVDHFDQTGWSVSGAGDINGDGFSDVIVGSPEYGYDGYTPMGPGRAYVLFGRSSGLANIDLGSAPLDGTNGFALVGEQVYDAAGWTVSDGGDVNGDGFSDLLIGAQRVGSGEGRTYVVYGQQSGFGASVDLADVGAGVGGFVVDGAFGGDQGANFDMGQFVSGAGDINGDGFDDLMVSARAADHSTFTNPGYAYVLFGGLNNSSVDLGTLTLDGSNGFTIAGAEDSETLGQSIADAGDVNADGFRDLIVGATGATNDAGAAYVIFGKPNGFDATIDVSNLGTDGFAINGASTERLGRCVSGAGDVNGDGYDDVVVTSFFDLQAYVVFGKASGFADLDASNLGDDDGFVITGFNGAPGGVSAAGDVNGDGFDDLLVGDQSDYRSYLILGAASLDGSTNHVTHQGTAANNLLVGDAADNVIIGGRGADSLFGGSAGADVIRGGEGADILAIGSATFLRVDGGTGNDRLFISGAMSLDDEDFGRISEVEGLILDNYDITLTLGRVASHSIKGLAANEFGLTIDGSEATSAAIILDGTQFGRAITLDLSGNSVGSRLNTGAGDDSLSGGSGADILGADGGDDTLSGGDGNDRLSGGLGANNLDGGAGHDIYFVNAATDQISDSAGNDRIMAAVDFTMAAGLAVEQLRAHGGGDIDLTGNALGQRIDGNNGENRITGGGGRDILFGKGDADTFIYTDVTDSFGANATRDSIRDFSNADADKIDLSAIDAITGGADDAFTFVAAFTGAGGELRVRTTGTPNVYVVLADVDGDQVADLAINVFSDAALVSTDFEL